MLGLSPFHLGPVLLYGSRTAKIFESAWQFAKVYPEHLDPDGTVSARYWEWAVNGWASNYAQRYPMGKGAKPAFCLWNEARLGYIDARLAVYMPLYRDAVAKTKAYQQLQDIYRQNGDITLFDFDGYDHDASGKSLDEVMLDPSRPMGHAFILKMMLEISEDVTPEMVIEHSKIYRQRVDEQATLF